MLLVVILWYDYDSAGILLCIEFFVFNAWIFIPLKGLDLALLCIFCVERGSCDLDLLAS